MSQLAFAVGQKILAWNPQVKKSEDSKYWIGAYQEATIAGLIAESGPADEPYYMVDFGSWMSGRDESDIMESDEDREASFNDFCKSLAASLKES